MPFDGNGTYNPPSPEYPAVADTTIEAADRNVIDLDIAEALTNCMTRDGQSPPTAPVPMGGQKLTGLAAGSNVGDAVRYEQLTAQAAGIGIAWTGPQNFTAAVLTVATQASGDNSAKAASTAFVTAAAFNAALPLQGPGTENMVPISDGTDAAWGLVELTLNVEGVLPVLNGGSGVTTKTGTGNLVLSDSPVLVTPNLGTPSAGVATNLTGTAANLTAGEATALETARTIDGQSFDGTANITVIAPGTNAAASKATPVDADAIPLVDSEAANGLKKLTWANLKAGLANVFAPKGLITASGLTQSTARLLGRTTAATGAVEEISVGSGLSLATGALTAVSKDSAFQLNTSNGYGSTNAVIRLFTNIAQQRGSWAIDYTIDNSATLGTSITINTADFYNFFYSESVSTAQYFGLSVNSNQLNTQLLNITLAHRLIGSATDATTGGGSCAVRAYLEVGDVVRPHTNAAAGGTTAFVQLRVSRG